MARALRPADVGLLLGLGAVWGTAFMFISLGLESFSPVLLAALRFDVSALTLLLVALALRRPQLVPKGRRQWAAVAIAGALNVAAYHGFLFWGQQFTTASIAAVIVGLNPVLTTVFSRWLLEDERVGLGGVLGLGLGFAGITLLASLKPGSPLDARGLGELAVVAAIAAWAMGSVLVKRQKHGMDVYAFIVWHSLVGAAVLHALALGLEGGGRATWDLPGTLSLFYLAVISSGLGFIAYFTLLEHVGPIRSNIVSYLAPVAATVAAFAVLGQPFEPRAALAYAFVAAGFWLIARPSRARAAARRAEAESALDAEKAP